ncbi:hypothetical protein [Methanoculleus sp. UBA303]|jgi:hypothetical protein|uniref:hypothetical protein n=1 Tax=Methanoculleus sp. UBA303 TaxID=1915497 RepID=UPI0025CE72C2|nr:hypothetical protein [Methanoculleus sp. UBA303]
MKIRLLEKVTEAFPYLVLVTYIAGFIFSILIDRVSYLVNGSILAIPAIIGVFTFIIIKKRDVDLSGNIGLFSYNPSKSTLLFGLLYTLTIAILLIASAESKWGLVAILILYVTILVQVLSRRIVPVVVLVETMLTLAVTIYSYTLRSALYFGATDTMPHIYMSTVTYLSGHIIPPELGNYTHFPLYHIFMALSSLTLGLDIQSSLFVTTCLIYISTVPLLYYLVIRIFRNEQISLLIILAYAMNANVTYYGTYMVTRTMAYVGFLILLYLLYSLASPKSDTESAVARPTARRVLVVIMLVFILLTHQISTPMIIILLGLLFTLELLIHDEMHVNLVFLTVPVALFACYWIFVAHSFIWELLPRTEPNLYKSIVFAKVEYLGLSFLVNRIDILLIVFFALLGALYLIWKQQPRYSIIFGILGLVAIFLNVPNILTTVFQFVEILRMDRFALLVLPFLALIMGVGMYIFAKFLSIRGCTPRWSGILLAALIAIYGIGSLGLVKDEPDHIRYSFCEEEIAGFDHVLKTVPSGSSLHSDYYTWRFFARQKFNGSERLGLPHYTIPYYDNYWLQNTLESSGEQGYIILPQGQFLRNGLLLGSYDEFDPENLQPYLPTEGNVLNISRRLTIEDKIYSNYGVELYRDSRSFSAM